MTKWLFDKNGQPQLFLHGDVFVSKSGTILGWSVRNNVYSLGGHHLGWFEKGVLYDGQNRVLAFTSDLTGHLPYRPGLSGVPGTPSIPGIPSRPGLSGVPGRPGFSGSWSSLDLKEFFGK